MSYNPNPSDLEFDLAYGLSVQPDYEMGRLLSEKARKKLKKVVKKTALGPLQLAHKITHGKKSPIRKMELKLQKIVGKALPFTKPFIQAHNKLSEKVYKGMEKVGIAKKGQTLLADKSQSTIDPTALAASYASKGNISAASPQLAAAQLASSVAGNANLAHVLTSENAQLLTQSQQFRGLTLAHLIGKAKGGNQAALSTLNMLRR